MNDEETEEVGERSMSVAFGGLSLFLPDTGVTPGPYIANNKLGMSELVSEDQKSMLLSVLEGLALSQHDWKERQLLFFKHYSSFFCVSMAVWQAVNLVMLPALGTFAPEIPVEAVIVINIADFVIIGCHTYCRTHGVYLDGSKCIPSWSFISDRAYIIIESLPMIPLEVVVAIVTQRSYVHAVWRLKVLLIMTSHNIMVWRLLKFLTRYSTMRLVRLSQLLFLISHFATCGHATIIFNSDPSSITHWMGFVNYDSMSTLEKYLISFDWSIKVSVGMFRGSTMPSCDFQLLYVLTIVIVGVCLYVTVLAQVSHLIHSGGMSETLYHEKINSVKDHLTYLNTPKPLQREILTYYRHVWRKCDFIVSGNILSELPADLLFRVDQYCAKETIKKLPAFEGVSQKYPTFDQQLMMHVVPVVILPGGYVYREGSSDKSIYFTMSGELEATIFNDGLEERLWDIDPGDIFGEFEAVRQCSRKYNIKAITYCNLLCLGQTELKSLCLEFPECETLMVKNTDKTCRRLSEITLTVPHKLVLPLTEGSSKVSPTPDNEEHHSSESDGHEVRKLLEDLHDTIAAKNTTRLAELLDLISDDVVPTMQSVPSLDPYSVAVCHRSDQCIEMLKKHGFRPHTDIFGRTMDQVRDSISKVTPLSDSSHLGHSASTAAKVGLRPLNRFARSQSSQFQREYSRLSSHSSQLPPLPNNSFDTRIQVTNCETGKGINPLAAASTRGSLFDNISLGPDFMSASTSTESSNECLALLAPNLLNAPNDATGGAYVTFFSTTLGWSTNLAYDACRVLVGFEVLVSKGTHSHSLDPLRKYMYSREQILREWGSVAKPSSTYYISELVQLALRNIDGGIDASMNKSLRLRREASRGF